MLLISTVEQDHVLFRQAFGKSNWKLFRCYKLDEGLRHLEEYEIPVVISERNLDAATWHQVLRATANLPYSPKLIVTSKNSGDDLWAEVLNLGGYDLLAKPLAEQEVFHVISHAWLAWKYERERQVALKPVATQSRVSSASVPA
ncbi:MAG: hypothetical protein GY953_30405 [bacterium]|nr:hypothetical protein [bacterium]